MPSRFAILHHSVKGGEHWDLMLEHGSVLATWQLHHEPVSSKDLPLVASRIGNHRKAYLEYEGPVSGDRGYVRRVDRGLVEWIEFSDDACVFNLRGGRLCGRFRLIARDQGWMFESA